MQSTFCHHSSVRVFLVSVLLVGSASCSAFAIYDAYIFDESNENYLVFKRNGAIAILEFVPDEKLASYGLLGVPAVPVYAGTRDVTTIALELELTLWEKSDFYFSVPCLDTSNGQLCPYSARLDARFQSSYWKLSADGEAQWISSFDSGPIEIVLPLPGNLGRIDDDKVFDYFGYAGSPPWNFAYVQLVFSYKCEAVCPDEFSLAADDVVVVSDKVRSQGVHQLRRTRVKDYDFSADPG
jgi:hypothetical protein